MRITVFFFPFCTRDSITLLTFFVSCRKKKWNFILEFVYEYFGMSKIENETGESSY